MNNFLAQAAPTPDSLGKIFGGGVTGAPLSGGDVSSTFSRLFAFGVNAVFVVSALFALTYLLWGAFDYVISGGEEAKVDTARKKMTNAVIGIILLVASLTLWLAITRNVLGIFGGDGGRIELNLPTIKDLQDGPTAKQCDPTLCVTGSSCPSGRSQQADSCPSGQVCCWFSQPLPAP